MKNNLNSNKWTQIKYFKLPLQISETAFPAALSFSTFTSYSPNRQLLFFASPPSPTRDFTNSFAVGGGGYRQ